MGFIPICLIQYMQRGGQWVFAKISFQDKLVMDQLNKKKETKEKIP